MASPRRGSGVARPAGAASQSLGSTTPRLWRNISSRRWMLDRPRQARGEPPESLPWWNVPRKMVRALGYDLAFALPTRDAAAQVSCASDGFSSVSARHHAGRQLRVSTANAVRGVAVVCGHATCRRGHCAKVQQPVPVTNLRRRKRILRKLAARPSMRAIRMLGYSLSKVWRNMFRGVVVEEGGLDRLRQFLSAQRVVVRGPRRNNTAVVYLPTHKSHIDYLLLSYVCFGYVATPWAAVCAATVSHWGLTMHCEQVRPATSSHRSRQQLGPTCGGQGSVQCRRLFHSAIVPRRC